MLYEVITAWAPDGRLLVSSNRGGQYQYYVLPAGGGELTPITAVRGNFAGEDLSPDGHTVVYALNEAVPDIYRLDVRKLTTAQP